METIHEVISSIRTYLSERLRNPFYGAFFVAWVVLNFRLVLILIGDGTWAAKINFIDTRLYVTWWHWAIYGYLVPIVAASLYVLTTPFISRWVSIFQRVTEKTTKARLLAIDGEVPLTRAEADQLRQKLFEAIEGKRLEQRRAQGENQELQLQINLLVDENKKLRDQVDKSGSGKGAVTLTLPDSFVAQGEGPIKGRLLVLPEDFVGVASHLVSTLVSRGLTELQASMLYVLRIGAKLERSALFDIFPGIDQHTLKVAFDQLFALELVDSTLVIPKSTVVSISSFGSQAIEGLISRGFTPPKQLSSSTEVA